MHFTSEISFQVHVDAVEIDEAIARVAKEQFGFEEGDRVKLHIEDGLKFVEKVAAEAGKFTFYVVLLFVTHAKHENISIFIHVCRRIMRCAAAFLFFSFALMLFQVLCLHSFSR